MGVSVTPHRYLAIDRSIQKTCEPRFRPTREQYQQMRRRAHDRRKEARGTRQW
jgi:hypothetical protein